MLFIFSNVLIYLYYYFFPSNVSLFIFKICVFFLFFQKHLKFSLFSILFVKYIFPQHHNQTKKRRKKVMFPFRKFNVTYRFTFFHFHPSIRPTFCIALDYLIIIIVCIPVVFYTTSIIKYLLIYPVKQCM